MKKKVLIAIVVAALVAVPLLWYLVSPAFTVIEMNEEFPQISKGNMTVIAQGEFMPGDHDVAGRAILLESAGKRILRFEDFETINGPDLFIYLSKDESNKDFINLGEIKATKGDVNYDVDSSIDISQYNHVLVWCRAFKVLFSYAELKS
ncbi:MAG TPA: DM13 domain-containing protein [Candidatus Nanoarchaeia archaeon]|nr:DM13 domain-containing protein [Candidatus Nanoarchaeia archaeon]